MSIGQESPEVKRKCTELLEGNYNLQVAQELVGPDTDVELDLSAHAMAVQYFAALAAMRACGELYTGARGNAAPFRSIVLVHVWLSESNRRR